MGFWAGIQQQFFPMPAPYDREYDTWWGIILTEFTSLNTFLQDCEQFREVCYQVSTQLTWL